MKMVEFTRDMRPHRSGETRVVPDAMAEKLIASGDAKPRDSVFDAAHERPASGQMADTVKSIRAEQNHTKPTIGKPYKTRQPTPRGFGTTGKRN